MPIKDPRDFYSLGDITANGQSLDGHIINILAAVQSVRFQQYTASPLQKWLVGKKKVIFHPADA